MAVINGKINFINYDKGYATIEYLANGKKKTVNTNISQAYQENLKEQKLLKKIHHYNMGDEVSFTLQLSPKGDRMIAEDVRFLFNNALSNFIHKAKTENEFNGYLKKVEDAYFIKERNSYVLFPLVLSQWELPPTDQLLNELVAFKINHAAASGRVTASLLKPNYITEFKKAVKLQKEKAIITATVNRITKHAVIVNIINDKLQSKLSPEGNDHLQPGDEVKVRISYISDTKLVIEAAK